MRPIARKITTLLAAIAVGSTISVGRLHAQIVPNPGDAGTIVIPVDNRFDISGGTLSGDGANLFHSLSQFGLTQAQVANFLANPANRNILVRVTGGDASRLDGLIQVSGSSANLFLMNPAGIVFGTNASLNVAGSFAATTATGIGFGANWFNASGSNNYEALGGNPSSYAFAVAQPGSIINAGRLAVGVGQQLTLLGGTVVSTGSLFAPQGQIVVAAVPGQSVVRLSQPGAMLSLDVQRPTPTERAEAWTLPVLSLPQLLTGGSATNATGLTVNPSGQVVLTGSGVQISPRNVAVREAIAAPGGTLLRGNVLTNAFPPVPATPGPSPADRVRSLAPPDRALPPTVSPVPQSGTVFVPNTPSQSIPLVALPSVSNAPVVSVPSAPPNAPAVSVPSAPPNVALPPLPAPLPSSLTPDCGVACPMPLKPNDNNSSTPIVSTPIVVFPATGDQTNSIVLPQALPQYPTQTTTSQASPVQTSLNQARSTQANLIQASSTEAGSAQASAASSMKSFLPLSDPEEKLSEDAIDDMNQASARSRRLAAIKKQVQKRWQPQPQLASQLHYRLLLDTKGAIQQVVPLGQVAATYLADLNLAPAAEPTVKRTVPGFEVTLTLSPDGTVEVLQNSLTLKN
ncbi:filamentous hemagglutinin N-terminal domain-containing protein [Phormidium sp. FACHB-592]|uniref:Filamentous hemagglutinin N-terminal domain-containing protein n=1 Tax=Stenomitos frigidus AS-A4 TaxID=2933935 RepID=A0ABV0KNN5_9CYAN|nr:filamentous hemagglutinin N-terminal domain-containing protein [Phormidium sp. FACHB-592]MBD2073157.1 filamentous hemagglutinin N-terminal domain-containing protein [Phormidium sp. FACHB-592]